MVQAMDVFIFAFALPLLVLAVLFVCIYGPISFCRDCISFFCIDACPETEDWITAAELAEQYRRSAAAEGEQYRRSAAASAAPVVEVDQTEMLAAAAVAPVVKELGYFPYSGAVEALGQRLVCAICLEVFMPGTACSEVPACRRVFHRDCIGAWMKNSKSTCPLCRALIVPGSERLSAAEDMV